VRELGGVLLYRLFTATTYPPWVPAAYGMISLDRKLGRIRKVYWRRHATGRAHCSAVFASEPQAFELAARVADVSRLVPQYFRQSAAGGIMDRSGKDVIDEVYPCLSFEAEYLTEPFALADDADNQ